MHLFLESLLSYPPQRGKVDSPLDIASSLAVELDLCQVVFQENVAVQLACMPAQLQLSSVILVWHPYQVVYVEQEVPVLVNLVDPADLKALLGIELVDSLRTVRY